MIILGIDPGSRKTGYGVIEWRDGATRLMEAGGINVAGQAFTRRICTIHEVLADLVRRIRPDAVAVESVFVHKNPSSALKLGQARGAAICAAGACGAEIHEYAPRQVKQALTGSGNADKTQVRYMVGAILKTDARRFDLDTSDALAVAICHSAHLNRAATSRRRASGTRSPGRGGRRAGWG